MRTASVMMTRHLGEIEWDAESEIVLPAGLPGFENERRLLPVEVPAQRPLIFLQSVQNPDVCFVSLPVRTIAPDFELEITDEDRAALALCENAVIGEDVLCVVLLMPEGDTVRANLDSPLVVNLHNSRCMQVFAAGHSRGAYRLGSQGRWEPICL